MFYAHLPGRAVLRLSGDDCIGFLQGLITADARRLEKGEGLYAALLSPQGKFLHDFFLTPEQGSVLLETEAAQADLLMKRLMLYRLRSKVTIAPAQPQVVTALWGEGGTVPEGARPDPRLSALGLRFLGEVVPKDTRPGDYEAHRLALGVPQAGSELIAEKTFLLDWALDRLGAVDYSKGCYVGQEVTARMHYRAQAKKAPFQLHAQEPLPEAPHSVHCGEDEAGELRSALGTVGLALLRLEAVEKAEKTGMPLRVGPVVVQATLPGWYAARPL